MVLILLTIIFSVLSLVMMSYLAMNTQMGPWIAPVFVVVSMMLAIPIVSRRWFAKYAIITIIAGSIGGMVGGCLGATIPSFYFLNKNMFLQWMQHPSQLAIILGLFVLCAGSLSFLVAYLIKDYLILGQQLKFPMSQLIYDIVAIDKERKNHGLMLVGIVVASVWNLAYLTGKTFLQVYVAQIHIIPLMFSVGFVAGKLVAIPVLIGLATRTVGLEWLHDRFFPDMLRLEFLVTFCIGMLLAVMLTSLISILYRGTFKEFLIYKKVRAYFKNSWLLVLTMSVLLMCSFLLKFSGVHYVGQLYVMTMLIACCFSIGLIVAEIGVVDLDSFVFMVLLPFVYHHVVTTSNTVLMVAVFSTLSLGMVADLLFSYKLADLAKISYVQILKYQIVGFCVAVVSAGFVIWWYIHLFGLDSMQLLAPKAHELDNLISFGSYNYQVLLCGCVWGWVISMLSYDTLSVIGATLMAPSVAVWLIVAGSVSHLVRHREKYFSLCFGVYAAHSLWIMVRAVLE